MERRKEEELRLLKMRLSELENEVNLAHSQEQAAVRAAKMAWEAQPATTTMPAAQWSDAGYAPSAPAHDSEAENAAKEAAAEARAKKFFRRAMNKNLAMAFEQWSDVTDSMMKIKHIMYRWKQRNLAKAFDQWHASNDRSAHKETVDSVAVKFVKRLKNRNLSAGWEKWHSWWADGREARNRLKASASRFKNPGLSKAFYRWAEMALARASKLRILRRVMQRHFSEGISKAWTTWMAYVEPYKIIKRAASLFLNQDLLKAFNAWTENTSDRGELRRQRDLMQNFVGRLANMELARGWSSWRDYIDARVSAWMSLDRVGRRWRMIGCSMAFGTWAGMAEARAENERLLQMFAGRLANMEVARAWNQWVAACDNNAKMRHVMMGIMSPLLRKTWLGWVRYHRMQHEGIIRKAGRRLWNIEDFFANLMWKAEQKTEHALHLDRRARRAAARKRRNALLGEDSSDDSDSEARRKPKKATSKVQPMYDEVELPARDGLASRRGGALLQVRGGGYLTDMGYLSYPLDDAGDNSAATAFIRTDRMPPPRR